MSDQHEKRLSWLAFVYDSAIKHGVFRPADVVVHATPEVLAKDLPKELLIRMFEVAFDTGKLTPEGMLGVTPPATLVKHIAPSILWETVRDAATRHGIASASANVPKTGKTPLRSWIAEVIANGLERELFTPADVTRHIPPGEWVKDVPLEVVAKMIASGLTRPSFDPRLALEHLTPQVIGEYVAPHLAWGVIDEGAVKAFELTAARAGSARATLKAPVTLSPLSLATPHVAVAVTPPPPPPAHHHMMRTDDPSPALFAAGGTLTPAVAQPTATEAAPAAAGWDNSVAESADAWVDSTDMVESVETTNGGGGTN